MKNITDKKQLRNHFIIGMIMGVAAQFIGMLDQTILGTQPWDFSSLLGDIDLYPLIIVVMICSMKNPKQILLNVFMYFLGLDVGYYAYTSIISIYTGIASGHRDMIFINITEDAKECAAYTFIGLLAGIWGYVMQKFRLKEKKLPYNIMLLPFLGLTALLTFLQFSDGQLGIAIVDSISLAAIIIIYYKTRIRKKVSMLGRTVTVTVDRKMGTSHPEYKDTVYPVNYGYIKGITAPDGEEQDAYILGVDSPVDEFTGKVTAVIRRSDDAEEKWVVAPENAAFSKEDIREMTHFQEQYFSIEIETAE